MGNEKRIPGYIAVIPPDVRYDKDLKPNEKLLYGEISALATLQGYCWAKNSYFADLYEVTIETVSRWISHLAEKGYIKTKIFYCEDGKTIRERRISIKRVLASDIDDEDDEESDDEPIDEKIKGIDKKIKQEKMTSSVASDLHIHTNYCDGKDSSESIIKDAVKKNLIF